jgi:PadR family transcriptional regulator, regulatory protein PadR
MQRDDTTDRVEIPPGTLHKTLSRQPLHGYAIAREIQRNSEDVLHVEEGSLYSALQKMLLKGWVTSEWMAAGPKRRARVYSLTEEGRAKLNEEISGFTRAMNAIVRVIQPA